MSALYASVGFHILKLLASRKSKDFKLYLKRADTRCCWSPHQVGQEGERLQCALLHVVVGALQLLMQVSWVGICNEGRVESSNNYYQTVRRQLTFVKYAID